ncbi:calcitonin gene-related peptide type 1 receptor-like isoform X1 [Asterias amurensis]|uniref:calcitonin gene-related peptide type 1 receptor-like isoform X1 n=2 Tax=Asterias amurensis TaxID=7602 RepID=UPI003AB8572D
MAGRQERRVSQRGLHYGAVQAIPRFTSRGDHTSVYKKPVHTWLILVLVVLLNAGVISGDKMDTQTPQQRERHINESVLCEYRMRTELPPDDEYVYCNMTFDTWDCWNYTRAGSTIVQPCPEWIPDSNPNKTASKICMPNGQWFRHPETDDTWTNYTSCNYRVKEDLDSNVHIVYYFGYGLSVISLCIASFIFFYFRSLGCPRVTIHKNLFISFILCGIVWLQWFALVTQNPALIADNPAFCKILLVLGNYFNTCNYFWMLSEGLYLHTVIVVAVFSENHRLHLYYIIGWVLPMIPVTIYTSFMLVYHQGVCWLAESEYEWCVASFIILVLFVNLILLLNIVRVLVTKLRATPASGSNTYTRAVRATLILLPLLGLHYILFPVKPKGNKVAETFYNYFIAVLLSFQGFFVACIFCFFNGEVKMQIRRKWYSYRWGHRGSVFGGRYGNMNTTITETVSTMSPNDRRSIDKGQNSPLLNKAPPPVVPTTNIGNGRTTVSGREIVPDEGGDNPKETESPARETYNLEENNTWDCNANADQDVCPSILIEDHDEQSSKTTEV